MHFFKFTNWLHPWIVLLLVVPFAGCAAAGAVSTVAQVANLALGAAGLTKPADPNATKELPLKIEADTKLNTDNYKHSYSVVIRIYQLKQSEGFQQAYYDVFLDPQKEKDMLGSDVIATKEITLTPGQKYLSTEKISVSADYLGVVALFQSPAAERWKLIFPTKDLKSDGIALGLNGCSMSVTSGETVGSNEAIHLALKLPASCG
jgi:type VI secretion system protein VasD